MADALDNGMKELKKKIIRETLKTSLIVLTIFMVIVLAIDVSLFMCGMSITLAIVLTVIIDIVLFILLIFFCKFIMISVMKKKFQGYGQEALDTIKKHPGCVLKRVMIVIAIYILICTMIVIAIFVSLMSVYLNMQDYIVGDIVRSLIMERAESLDVADEYKWMYDLEPDDTPRDSSQYAYEGDILVKFALEEMEITRANDSAAKADAYRYWEWYKGFAGWYPTPLLDDDGDSLNGTYPCSRGIAGKSAWDWCANFVSYCIYNSGLCEPGAACEGFDQYLQLGCEGYYTDFTNGNMAGTWHLTTKIAGKIAWVDNNGSNEAYTPQPGDIIIFGRKGWQHIGIVEKTDLAGNVHTIEGNVGSSMSRVHGHGCCVNTVNQKDRGVAGYSDYYSKVFYFTPNYKRVAVPGTSGSIGNYIGAGGFDLSKYPTNSEGIYDSEVLEHLLYDFLVLEGGYNSAGACGILANMMTESSTYDQLEAANNGKAYVSMNTASKYYAVPSGYGNHNYGGCPDIDNTLWVTQALYYVNSKSASGYTKYGMGYGIVQWSFGRRTNLFNFALENGLGKGYGMDSFPAQLAFVNHELNTDYSSVMDDIKALSDDADGAYQAAYIFESRFERSAANSGTCPKCGAYFSASYDSHGYRDHVAKCIYWPKLGNTPPSISNSGASGVSGTPVAMNSVTMIGDSNTVRAYSYSELMKGAKHVFATVGVGLVGNNSWDAYSSSSTSASTVPNQTLKEAISACRASDLSHVAIMLGSNNAGITQDKLYAVYDDILNCIRGINDKAIVSICTIPPVNDNYSSYLKTAETQRISNIIKQYVADYRGSLTINLIDVNSQLTVEDMSAVPDDGYHVSIDGAKKLAEIIAAGIK